MSAILWILAGLGALLLALLVYAGWIEPAMRLRVKRWPVKIAGWQGDPMRIVIISDLHAGAPYISLDRVSKIVDRANAEKPDLAILLGDYGAAHPIVTSNYSKFDIIDRLKPFDAPLGRYAVLGNHDWWQDVENRDKGEPCEAQRALEAAEIPMITNSAEKIELPGGGHFWLLGLGDQRPFDEGPHGEGFDDLPGAMSQVLDDAPAILIAHEPDIFPVVPRQVALTLSGHTHGGQIKIWGKRFVIMASENEFWSYGRYEVDDRTLIVSGGTGCSEAPLRFRVPPEITVIDVSAA